MSRWVRKSWTRPDRPDTPSHRVTRPRASRTPCPLRSVSSVQNFIWDSHLLSGVFVPTRYMNCDRVVGGSRRPEDFGTLAPTPDRGTSGTTLEPARGRRDPEVLSLPSSRSRDGRWTRTLGSLHSSNHPKHPPTSPSGESLVVLSLGGLSLTSFNLLWRGTRSSRGGVRRPVLTRLPHPWARDRRGSGTT